MLSTAKKKIIFVGTIYLPPSKILWTVRFGVPYQINLRMAVYKTLLWWLGVSSVIYFIDT